MRSPANARLFSSHAGSVCGTELSYCSPPEEVGARWWLSVPLPVEITHGAIELGLIDISVVALPAANTTVMPASCAALVAWLIGSAGSKSRNDEPHELFVTWMFHSVRCARRWSYASIALKTNTASPMP